MTKFEFASDGAKLPPTPLSLPTLRKANQLRLPLFKNAKGGPAHSKPDGSDWSAADWLVAIMGEMGEAANLLKKVRRGDMTMDEANIGDELADIVTYTDIAMLQFKMRPRLMVDLGEVKELTNFDLIRQAQIAVLSRDKETQSKRIGELSDMLVVCNVRLGIIGSVLEALRMGQVPLEQVLSRLQNEYSLIFGSVDIFANYCGVNLGEATRDKFNVVSERVSADVFIFADDTVRNKAGTLLDFAPEDYDRVTKA